jgi:leucyl aminopeptidase
MEVKLAGRSEWTGKVTVVPAFSGVLKGATWADGALRGLKVGTEEGETTVVRSEDRMTVVQSLGERAKRTTDVFRRAGGVAAKWLIGREVNEAAIDAEACKGADASRSLGALCEGAVLGSFQFGEFKSGNKRQTPKSVAILVSSRMKSAAAEVSRAAQVSAAANTARELAHQPPNVIDPVSLAAWTKKMCARRRLTCKVVDEQQLERLKMGGILAVGQGSDKPPRLIVVEYRGKGKGKPVVLIGKAITFDTGGYSIKPRDGITGMKYDKCGGAVVLGTMQAAAELRLRTPLVGIIAAAENMVSGGAYRPDDIITTMSGKTVEIVSADAEGRMVLCDALTYAQKHYQPRALIDVATLTGGVVVALGKHRAGLFSSDDRLRTALMDAGRRSDELLWPLPLDDEYLELLKGTDSDLRNSGSRDAHAIQGAIFLKQFVEPKVPWAHLDIAGVATIDKDGPYCPKGATGFGVRLLAHYMRHLRS